jgi:hypothetical protein
MDGTILRLSYDNRKWAVERGLDVRFLFTTHLSATRKWVTHFYGV